MATITDDATTVDQRVVRHADTEGESAMMIGFLDRVRSGLHPREGTG